MQSSDLAFEAARRHMVESQLMPNKVNEPTVLAAVAGVPRELFVPQALRGVAYMDEDIDIAPGRFLMEPMVFARLLQEAAIDRADLVLDVGCGSGYSTAVLAKLASTVVGLESDASLAQQATAALARLGIDNAAVVQGALEAGLPAQGPFDVILVEGAMGQVPDALTAQLADGGRLLGVVNSGGPVGHAVLLRKVGGLIARRVLFDAGIRRLPGFEAPKPGFVF
jgi:protein-L-isoaspartate(D-aspartate) O-methyltransferase